MECRGWDSNPQALPSQDSGFASLPTSAIEDGNECPRQDSNPHKSVLSRLPLPVGLLGRWSGKCLGEESNLETSGFESGGFADLPTEARNYERQSPRQDLNLRQSASEADALFQLSYRAE